MAGTKRKHTDDSDANENAKKAKCDVEDGQKASSKNVNIPIDEGFLEQVPVIVYVDKSSIIYDASLAQTNIGKNANKACLLCFCFYRLQVLQSKARMGIYYTHTRWGRVGVKGTSKTFPPASLDSAVREFENKFKEKTGHRWDQRSEPPKKGKYVFLNKMYEDPGEVEKLETRQATGKNQEKELASNLPLETQSLMELIFNEKYFDAVLKRIGYNDQKLPLGQLGKPTIRKGFEWLQELAELIKNPAMADEKYNVSYDVAVEDLSNQYYSTIPHSFGRYRATLIDSEELVKRESEMLGTLSDMEVATVIMETSKIRDTDGVPLIDKRFKQLNMEELVPLDHESAEFAALKDYLITTSGHTHFLKYRLQDIFRISRIGESERFLEKSNSIKDASHSCRRLLWHGSRTTNFGGILSQGLRIAPPEAPASGYMFGKGVYLADISSKSANYCVPELSGQQGLLLLCEAELGPIYHSPTADYQAEKLAKDYGCFSTMGAGCTVPKRWVDAGKIHPSLSGVCMPDTREKPIDKPSGFTAGLQYNEYICYDVAQVRLRYLLRVGMTYEDEDDSM